MKRNVILAAVLLFSSMMFAAVEKTAIFQIEMSYSGGTNTDVLQFTEVKGLPENMYQCTNKFLNSGLPQNINVYSLSDKTSDGMQSTYTTDSLVTMPIGVTTNCGADQSYSYKLTVTNVTDLVEGHTPMYLCDLYEGVRVSIADGNYLEFDANLCDTINDRFLLLVGDNFTPDAGELEVCHQNGKLEVRNNPYTTAIVVKDESNQEVRNFTPMPTPFSYSLESLPAGHYTVEFGGGAKKYIIAVKPEVETETPAVP